MNIKDLEDKEDVSREREEKKERKMDKQDPKLMEMIMKKEGKKMARAIAIYSATEYVIGLTSSKVPVKQTPGYIVDVARYFTNFIEEDEK